VVVVKRNKTKERYEKGDIMENYMHTLKDVHTCIVCVVLLSALPNRIVTVIMQRKS